MKPTTSFPKVIGLCKRGIGALPVGLKGKLYGAPFKVLVQYEAFGGAKAQIYEDDQSGGLVGDVRGDWKYDKNTASGFGTWAYLKYKREKPDRYDSAYGDRKAKYWADDERDIRKKAEAFVKQLSGEVAQFNKAKNPKTVKAKAPVKLGPAPKKPAAKKPAAKAPAKKLVTKTIKVKEYCVKSHNRTIRVPAKK